MTTVAVLGHRGMLGQVVARYFAEGGADVRTTELRWFPTCPSRFVDWAAESDYVVNCIKGNWVDLALLPLQLGERCNLIQPSTDAIAEDTPYAEAKRIAERCHGLVIRAGLIDVDNQPQTAYINWLCNPVTPLEWAQQAWRWMGETGTRGYGRNLVTRWQVAYAVAQVYGRPTPRVGSAGDRNRVQECYDLPPLAEALETFREWMAS